MSTENNLDKTFNSSVKILSDLIAFKSISGEDNNSIINYCEKIFNDLGDEIPALPIPVDKQFRKEKISDAAPKLGNVNDQFL